MRVHDRFIVVAQVSERTFVATGAFKYAHSLSKSQQAFVEIIDSSGVSREERLQEAMCCVGAHFFPDEPYAHRGSVNVYINREYGHSTAKEQHAGRCFRANAIKAVEPCHCFLEWKLA